MNDASFGRVLLGLILIIVGLCHVLFFRRIKEFSDALRKHDPLLRWAIGGLGNIASRRGLIFTHAITVIFGLALFAFGVVLILNLLN